VSSVYFAFPDGVFDYVCAECTALCCRGHGFAGSLEREVGQLLTAYPELESAVVERRGDIVSFASASVGCHFLDGDNRCRIEKEHGYDLKPGVCRLFPFNSFSLIGKTLVVSPHFLCPLRIRVPAEPGAVEGTHERLEPHIRESGLVNDTARKLTMRKARLHPSKGVRSVLARETAFRDQCAATLGVGTFSECVRGAAEDAAGLDRSVSRGAALLGLEPRSAGLERDGMDDVLLAIAPTLRLSFLGLTTNGILIGLALAELVARRVTALSQAAPTPQQVTNVFDSMMPALHLLGCTGAPVVTAGRGKPKTPPFGDPAMVFAGYIVLRQVGSEADILDTLESGMQRIEAVSDRTAFLVEMGRLIGASHKRTKTKAKRAT
jgi:hypothetical protein